MANCIDHPEVEALEKQIAEMKQKLAVLRREKCDRRVRQDYTFRSWDGRDISLAQLFGDKRDLILIHNMGKHCPYCTLWADGFNGLSVHLENRAAFVLVNNDPIDVQKTFAESRGWKFKMFSSAGTSFFKDMGFETGEKKFWPGVSTFYKDDAGEITRIAHSYFGPGDDFCAVWPMFDLLQDGANNWQPKFRYNSSAPVAVGVKRA